MARTGAFYHLIRRRAAMADTGLQDVRDVKDHILGYPFLMRAFLVLALSKN
jgi:hypothetical protein